MNHYFGMLLMIEQEAEIFGIAIHLLTLISVYSVWSGMKLEVFTLYYLEPF